MKHYFMYGIKSLIYELNLDERRLFLSNITEESL